jgi:small subunit ribosomal protein S16
LDKQVSERSTTLVKIRLKRMGTTKRPVYRLVVADSRSPRDGRFIESIGFYDPLPNPAVVHIDAERVQLWLRRGARPSDSARQLLVKEGLLVARPFKITARVEPAEPAAVAAKPAPAVDTGAADAAPDVAAAPAATEPAIDEPSAAEEPAATAAADAAAAGSATTDEAGGVAGGSPDAPEARRGGVPAATGPAAAEDADEPATTAPAEAEAAGE